MATNLRPFARSDRDRLTELINRHVAAVTPGVALSVNAVMSQIEGEPLNAVVDPWVADRLCLVAERDGRLVAAGLLHRFADDDRVAPGYRNAGEFRYLVCEPDEVDTGIELVKAGLEIFRNWKVYPHLADGALPTLGCVGVPDVWPHIREIYAATEFEGPGRTDVLYVADCAELTRFRLPKQPVTRQVGPLGTVLSMLGPGDPAWLGPGPGVAGPDGEGARRPIASIEICHSGVGALRATGAERWADVANLRLADGENPRTIGPALYGLAARWLLHGGATRLVDYRADDVDSPFDGALLRQIGFEVLSRNARGWRQPG